MPKNTAPIAVMTVALAAVLFAQGTQPSGAKHTTPGGVIVEQTRAGEGAKEGDVVFVHYSGRLSDGTQIDTSYERAEPISIVIGERRVIRGWEEGLQGMQVGEKRTLTIPPEMAWGKEGRPPKVPPNATVIFEIELMGMQRR